MQIAFDPTSLFHADLLARLVSFVLPCIVEGTGTIQPAQKNRYPQWHYSTGTKKQIPKEKRKKSKQKNVPGTFTAAAAAKKARDQRRLLDPFVSHSTGPHRLVRPYVPCCFAFWAWCCTAARFVREAKAPLSCCLFWYARLKN